MEKKKQAIHILMADDDEDDRLMTEQAFKQNKLKNNLHFAKDGEELMQYLKLEGKYTYENAPKPGLILLDLNMPKKDGRECLKEIKSDPKLKHIPVVILTTSRDEEDIFKSYNLGVNSFIVKPVSFKDLLDIVIKLNIYWFELVQLPESQNI
jgi:CheY-like chemotaxis protein